MAAHTLAIVAAHEVRRIGAYVVWTGRCNTPQGMRWTYEYQRAGDAQTTHVNETFPHLRAVLDHATTALTSR